MADKDESARAVPALDPEALARAERAVVALGDDFVARIGSELHEIRLQIEKLDDMADDSNLPSIKTVFAFAHDMRGQGGSFGYPLLSEIGRSLSGFLEGRECDLTKNDVAVLRAHLDAAAAVISSTMSGDGDGISRALVDSLDTLVEKRLAGQT